MKKKVSIELRKDQSITVTLYSAPNYGNHEVEIYIVQ